MMSAQLVQKAWKRIEAWCHANDPQLLRELNPGASKKEIRALEVAIDQPLPEDVQTSLSIHNGQPMRSNAFLFGRLKLLSCEEIASEHSFWAGAGPREPSVGARCYPENALAHLRFHRGWIPVVDEEGCGNGLAVDLAPGTAGTVGQVIDFGRDILFPGVMASSWGEFLHSYADLLDTLTEISETPEECFDTFYRLCDINTLDALVLWARDGRWPIVRFEPFWRTSTVMSLARTMSKTRDFSAMPILADALQEAGCEVAAVLDHCRDQRCDHARGCWVIETLVSGHVTDKRQCHEYGH